MAECGRARGGGGAALLRAGAATLLYTVWRLLESCLRPAPAHTIATEPRPPALFLLAKVTCPDNMIPREVMMAEGNGVASVIILTFTKMPGPHADTAWAVVG